MKKETVLPTGWEIKPMAEVVVWGSGGTPKATEPQYYDSGNIPWLIIGDLNDGVVTESQSKITEFGLQNSSAKMIPSGTLLVAMYGSIGKLGITGIKCCTNQAIAFAKELHGVSTKYMFFYMAMMKSKLISLGKGGTQKNISQTVLNSLDVIVPPIEVQTDIVYRVEELFSELDKAVETLQTTKQQLAVYRQAVLKEAFSGCNKITAFGEISESRLGKMLDREKNIGIPQKYLRNINVRWFVFDLTDILNMRIEKGEEEKYSIRKGDLVICEGGEPGRCAVWKQEETMFYQKALHRVRFKSDKKPEFYMYYLWFLSQTGQLTKFFTGTGIKHLTGQSLVKIPVPEMNIMEQTKILYAIESRLSVCDSIEHTVDKALAQADAMRQSILKQAFEGRLV